MFETVLFPIDQDPHMMGIDGKSLELVRSHVSKLILLLLAVLIEFFAIKGPLPIQTFLGSIRSKLEEVRIGCEVMAMADRLGWVRLVGCEQRQRRHREILKYGAIGYSRGKTRLV